ncbi:MAG: tRNA uridine-5-carboxymethylaminomethyl(34) synthesis GTPase MnmE [Thermodesulfobacteriota bacterium]
MDENVTIAAISTPVGPGGISIIRISGAKAGEAARTLFKPRNTGFPLKSHRLYLGHVVDPGSGRLVDQVLCCHMYAPATYTREDVVEFHCHGGPVVAARVLELVLRTGVELARPGEFTRRAFMAGRIDLSEAEAVAELIAARSEAEARLAAAQLAGGMKERTERLRRPLVETLAQLEAALDFPDEEIEILDGPILAGRLEGEVLAGLDQLLEAYDDGRVFREGVKAAIVGRPNVGKSSLLNALVKAERAIVHPRPGTTRDLIRVEASIEGIPLTIIDTAGLETPAADEVEAEGQRRAAAELAGADLALLVLDVNRPLSGEDSRIGRACLPARTVAVLNKSDLEPRYSAEEAKAFLGLDTAVEVSALTGKGLVELGRTIFTFLTGRPPDRTAGPELAPNLRHKIALARARPFVERAADGLRAGLAPELVALEINEALGALGEITGRTTPEEVLDEIFRRFCLGK